MTDKSPCLSQIFLKPGEIFFDASPACVTTVLGSCVAVTMSVRRLELTSICHAQLPHCRDRSGCSPTCREKYKFVDCSIMTMLDNFSELGVPPSGIEIKIFGGADGIRQAVPADQSIKIGRMNIAAALETLDRHAVKPINGDVGGYKGRKIYFLTPTGEVWAKKISIGDSYPSLPERNHQQEIILGGFTICSPLDKQHFSFL